MKSVCESLNLSKAMVKDEQGEVFEVYGSPEIKGV